MLAQSIATNFSHALYQRARHVQTHICREQALYVRLAHGNPRTPQVSPRNTKRQLPEAYALKPRQHDAISS
jgi:hypothetical protein